MSTKKTSRKLAAAPPPPAESQPEPVVLTPEEEHRVNMASAAADLTRIANSLGTLVEWCGQLGLYLEQLAPSQIRRIDPRTTVTDRSFRVTSIEKG